MRTHGSPLPVLIGRRAAVLAAFAVALAAGACRTSEERAAQEKSRPLVVFAASSLREAFEALAEVFEREPGVSRVSFNFAGSQQLRTQLEQGAVADVFASADPGSMQALVSAGRVRAPKTFAQNELVLVVDSKQAQTFKSFSDLPAAKRVVIGAPEVPVGKYTLRLFDNASKSLGADFRARVESHVVSRELNVRQVLSKVTLGEADVGVVYRSDVAVAKDVAVVAIPKELNVIAEYPIALSVDGLRADLAQRWVALVLSETGAHILQKHGFLTAAAERTLP
jgi:molybdate transport system substrate-binding protein